MAGLPWHTTARTGRVRGNRPGKTGGDPPASPGNQPPGLALSGAIGKERPGVDRRPASFTALHRSGTRKSTGRRHGYGRLADRL